ncbi:MAG: TRAP transporter small permease subunit [Thiogranum sp.]|nr:TRAP transporter small permease subunit [Thiogranum sp.]
MELLRSLRDRLVQLETALAAISLLLLLLLAVLQIVARNFFDTGIASADTLTRYLVLYITFFGAAVAIDRDRHIKIDAISTLLSPQALRTLYRPLRAVAALVCGFLSDAAIRFWLDEVNYAAAHERWQIYVGFVIPLGFVLLTLQFVLAALLGPGDEQ